MASNDWRTMTQSELDKQYSWGSTAPAIRTVQSDDMQKLAEILLVDVIRVTYEVSGIELLHPDPTVTARMREIALSKCGYGCKVYADPRSNVRVLAHNRAYGCPQ